MNFKFGCLNYSKSLNLPTDLRLYLQAKYFYIQSLQQIHFFSSNRTKSHVTNGKASELPFGSIDVCLCLLASSSQDQAYYRVNSRGYSFTL